MVYIFDEYELDTDGYELRRTGKPLHIEPKPFALLAYLVQQRGRAVAKDELFQQLWPKQCVGDDALVYCIGVARKAVGDSGSAQRLIKTVHRRGYRFIAPVEERSQALSVQQTLPIPVVPALVETLSPDRPARELLRLLSSLLNQ